LGEAAFVLFLFPVQREGADGAEFGQVGIEDAEVEIVSGVYPDEDEEGEIRADDPVVEVVEGLGRLPVGHVREDVWVYLKGGGQK